MGNDFQPTISAARRPRARWKIWLALALLLGGAYWWTFWWLGTRWSAAGSYYSHGWLIAPAAVFLAWTRKSAFARCPARPEPRGFWLIGSGLFIHFLAMAWRVGFLSGFSFIAVAAGIVLTLFGRAVFRLAAFPLLFLVFMIPLPEIVIEDITFASKMLAADLAARLVGLLGTTVTQQGSVMHLRAGTVIIDDVCGGLKYMISLAAFGAAFACLSRLRFRGKALIIILTLPLAIIANVFRVSVMLLVAAIWSPLVLNYDWFHYGLGMLVFVGAFVFFFLLERLLRRGRPGPINEIEAETGGAATARPEAVRPAIGGKYAAACLILLAAAAGISTFLGWPRAVESGLGLAGRISATLGEWSGRDNAVDERSLSILGTRDVLSRTYEAGSRPPTHLLLVFAEHTRRATHPPELCLRGEGCNISARGERRLDLGRWSNFPVRELRADRGTNHQILMFYFFKHGDIYDSVYWRHQLRVAMAQLLRAPADDVLVRLETPLPDGDAEAARGRLEEFLWLLMPEIDARLKR